LLMTNMQFEEGKQISTVNNADFDTKLNATERLHQGKGRSIDEYIARAADCITAFDGKFNQQK
jgi:hypothetical protein